ncbi:hypothetical protein V8B55DRAFT_1534867 [Mucor lusitanicus]|uniref:Uncharacterized protein n=1 Tax=Mucor circinelloides f. lusitanicus TaxID=29924 RepID=A0A8H4F0Q8_MUCCL|nr:hypothetical protein FB192DRAFT_1458967 [Mucor lusitanicus]
MDSPSDTNLEKVPFDSKDFLALESKFQDYVQQVLQEATIGSLEERDMLKSELEQWTSSIFTSLADNSAFTDTEGMDNRGKPNLLDPTDEELKEKVKQKELEFNADLKKVVKYRAQAPSALAKLSREICESESMEAENLKIELSATDTSEDQLDAASLESAKKEYIDAMQLLSNLEKITPKEVSQIAKVQQITALFIDGKDMGRKD